ncbi:MAG: DUF5711 family protein [Oscillospiraceae bacterium]|nr:DUF5711 family protein [Oscillospiraceae bacterium]MCL2249645.1 DUF5711 family protein [Oscillospiraceae bacterium]
MRKEKKRRWLRFVIVIAVSLALTLITVIIVQSFSAGTFAIFPRRSPVFTVDELNFDIGRNRVFAKSGGAVAAAGTFGIQVLNADGEEILRDTFRMFNPAITEQSGYFLVFDIGGTELRVFNSSQVIHEVETTGHIVSATINQNGWFPVVTQEPGAFRGTIQVYNDRGAVVYRVDLGSGFPVAAILSENNNNLAVLNLADAGSRVTFYRGIDEDNGEPYYQFQLRDTVIFDIKFTGDDEILAISTESVLRIDNTGEGTELFNFRGRRLGGFAYGEGFIALNLYDYGVGYTGQIVTVDIDDGTIMGEHRVHREIISMSFGHGQLAVLQSNAIAFFNENMEEYLASEENTFAVASNRILMLGENVALATNDSSALLVRR